MGNFYRDKQIGIAGEDYIKSVLENQGFRQLEGSNGSKYDAIYETPWGDMLKVEIKNETAYAESLNTFIEVSCSNKPSGAFITEAKIMIHLFGDKIRVHDVAYLRWLLITEKFKKINCGDGYKVVGYLIPRDYDSPYLQECTEDELGSVIENLCSM